jgi:hypothetical protein
MSKKTEGESDTRSDLAKEWYPFTGSSKTVQ